MKNQKKWIKAIIILFILILVFICNKENIIKFQYTENGRVLFGDEIDSIIAYLKSRGIPLTQRTYQGAYHEYVNGRLQIKQIWINS